MCHSKEAQFSSLRGLLQEITSTAYHPCPFQVGSDGALDQLRHQQSESEFRGAHTQVITGHHRSMCMCFCGWTCWSNNETQRRRSFWYVLVVAIDRSTCRTTSFIYSHIFKSLDAKLYCHGRKHPDLTNFCGFAHSGIFFCG